MRFLVRLSSSSVRSEALLTSVRSLAKSVGVEARNPKWTSRGALELDVFSPSRGDFDLFVSVVSPVAGFEFVRDLNRAPPHRAEAELFSEAREYFNDERYWECHEVLEGIWRLKLAEEKRFLQGIILVCAAFVHHQKGEDGVALGVLKRAAKQLDFPAKEYGGFDVAVLRENVQGVLGTEKFINFRV